MTFPLEPQPSTSILAKATVNTNNLAANTTTAAEPGSLTDSEDQAQGFYPGQAVIWLQPSPGPLGASGFQGIACDVVRVIENKVQIELERMGRLTRLVVGADTLKIACPDCKMWPLSEGQQLCEGCAELEQALSVAADDDSDQPNQDPWNSEEEEVPNQLNRLLDKAADVYYAGLVDSKDPCPVCGSRTRQFYASLDNSPGQAICEECGLDESWFGPVRELRYSANQLLYTLERLVDKLEHSEYISNLDQLKATIERNRQLLSGQ